MIPGGYAWWYLDALTDDGQHGLTLIAFLGSVFSPYYARARRRGDADPLQHVALNVALYGVGMRSWAMTERGRGAVARTATSLAIGPSALTWEGDALCVHIDEIAVPIPHRIRGTVRLYPAAWTAHGFALDAAGHHVWHPLAPVARVEVALDHPALRWSGSGYLDSNTGTAPLERDFVRWDWSRATIGCETLLLYDVAWRGGGALALALRCDARGGVTPFGPPPPQPLPRTLWQIARATRADAHTAPRVEQTLEDTPFYARSLLATQVLGTPARAVHESLSLERFRTGWVQALLPFRMPRRR